MRNSRTTEARKAALLNFLKFVMTANKLAVPIYSASTSINKYHDNLSDLATELAFYDAWKNLLVLSDGFADVAKYVKDYRQRRALAKTRPQDHGIDLKFQALETITEIDS